MTISDSQFERLSALVDGEVSDQELCDVLTEVVDNPAAREELRQLVELRRTTGQWRNARQSPSRDDSPRRRTPDTGTSSRAAGSQSRRFSGSGYLAATVVGGLLVSVGLLLGRIGSNDSSTGSGDVPHNQSRQDESQRLIVAPQQQRQAAEVFAFHESVTGPLSWFVSDEDQVLLGSPVVADDVRRPAAVQLRIRDGSSNRDVGTWLVICRDGTRAVMELPVHDEASEPVRLSLLVEIRDQAVAVDYSLLFGTLKSDTHRAHLSGQRRLTAAQAAVGQVFLNDRLLTVDAAAWALTDGESSL